MTTNHAVRSTPHIRLNSGQQDPIIDATEENGQNGSYPASQATSRSSTPGLQPGSSVSSVTRLSGTTESPLLSPPPWHPAKNDYDTLQSPDQSRFPSQRTSWSSAAGSDDFLIQSITEKYNIVPSEGLLLFPEDIEQDDDLHNPNSQVKDRDCEIWSRRGIVNVGGLLLLTLGCLALFIAYPIVASVEKLTAPTATPTPTPTPTITRPTSNCSVGDTLCLDVGPRPLLTNIRTGLIDPDTPDSAKTKISADGKELKLVFSDEFNTDGRTFYDEDDPFFQAVNIWYGVTGDLEWYDPDAVTTKGGVLEIRFDEFENHDLSYRSGMIQSWNKLCFTGGRLEASISLPGRGDIQGFWPGFWAMGNLGRPGYSATTDGMWPYSYYDECDAGITPNQSSTDGISWLPGMRLPACTCPGADHPTPGKSRSAPEIDVLEANIVALNNNISTRIGQVSQSLQIAPFDIWYMPDYDFAAVYDDRITEINAYRGGVYQQAMSGLSNLNNDWYNGTEYQIYAFEYTPGETGNVTWFVGADKTWTIDGRAIGPNGNIGQRVIPQEPMAIIANLGMATDFAPNSPLISTTFPGIMRIDYVRIYQDKDSVSVTCDPPGYETTTYISDHPDAYANVNLTTWAGAGYDWPKNSFMHEC